MRTERLKGIRAGTVAVALAGLAVQGWSQTAVPPQEQVERLKQELDAQLSINKQLRGRIEVLERQLAAQGRAVPQAALDTSAPRPPQTVETAEARSAIEEALGAKGLQLLAPGKVRVTPGLTFATSGSGATRVDTEALSISADVGLPAGLMLSARVPYVRHESDAFGSVRGRGDAGVALSAALVRETDQHPSLVGRVGYTDGSVNDLSQPFAVGSGFKSWDVGVSTVKHMDPVVAYGGLSYSHAQAASATLRDSAGTPFFTGRIAPGNAWGVNGGLSLAATPDISVDAGLSFNFFRPTRYAPAGGTPFDANHRSEGYVNLGAGFLVRKDLFLTVNAAAGVTSEAAKFIFSVAVPYRF